MPNPVLTARVWSEESAAVRALLPAPPVKPAQPDRTITSPERRSRMREVVFMRILLFDKLFCMLTHMIGLKDSDLIKNWSMIGEYFAQFRFTARGLSLT
jgi:hypothetical protein